MKLDFSRKGRDHWLLNKLPFNGLYLNGAHSLSKIGNLLVLQGGTWVELSFVMNPKADTTREYCILT